jgi:hypothetical protein
LNLILTVSNPYKYHSFSFIFHLASSLALKGGDSTERGVGLGGGLELEMGRLAAKFFFLIKVIIK